LLIYWPQAHAPEIAFDGEISRESTHWLRFAAAGMSPWFVLWLNRSIASGDVCGMYTIASQVASSNKPCRLLFRQLLPHRCWRLPTSWVIAQMHRYAIDSRNSVVRSQPRGELRKVSRRRSHVIPVSRDRVEKALVEALNKGGLTNLRTVAASVGLSSTRRFYKDFRNLRLAVVAKNREIRKQRVHVIANTTQALTGE
jgi:hypothetical protein